MSDVTIQKMCDILVGTRVEMLISEPWDFGESVSQSLVGTITQVLVRIHARDQSMAQREQVLVTLDRPFGYNSLKCQHFLASPRHEEYGFAEFLAGANVSFNFQRIREDMGRSDDPFEMSSWRGEPESFGLIGSMTKG